MKQLALFLLILILFSSFALNKGNEIEYRSTGKNLRLILLNGESNLIKHIRLDTAILILSFLEYIDSERIKVRVNLDIIGNESLSFEAITIFNTKNYRVWFENGSYIGTTLFFMPRNLLDDKTKFSVGLKDLFLLRYISSGVEEYENLGYRDIIQSEMLYNGPFNKFYNLTLDKYFNFLKYDKNSNILLYFESNFMDPLLFVMGILALGVSFKIFKVNFDIGPQNFYMVFLFYFPYIILGIIIIIIFVIIKRIRK